MKKPVAFFDIDGTVFRSSLLVELVDKMVEEGIFPVEAKEQYQNEYIGWRSRESTYAEYISSVIKVFRQNIKGVYYGDLADVGRRVVAVQSKYVYRYTRDLIKKLKADGYYLVAISQSPKTILDEFCPLYGFDKVYGRMYEIGPQDCFTGLLTDEHIIENKANIVKRVFDKNEFLTRESSLAVGDTDGDIPLLEQVANPICFNPNQALYNQAKIQGWTVVVERKDVIYQL